MRSNFVSVDIVFFSFCSPSLAPTSTMRTRLFLGGGVGSAVVAKAKPLSWRALSRLTHLTVGRTNAIAARISKMLRKARSLLCNVVSVSSIRSWRVTLGSLCGESSGQLCRNKPTERAQPCQKVVSLVEGLTTFWATIRRWEIDITAIFDITTPPFCGY